MENCRRKKNFWFDLTGADGSAINYFESLEFAIFRPELIIRVQSLEFDTFGPELIKSKTLIFKPGE